MMHVPADSDEIEDLELTVTLRNNQLKARRRARSLTQAALADCVGIPAITYSCLERLHLKPMRRDGTWTDAALRLAAFFCVRPEDLFSPTVLAIERSRAVRQIGAAELAALAMHEEDRLLAAASDPLEVVGQRELREKLRSLLDTLAPREATVIEMRFGLRACSEHPEYGGEHTLAQVGEHFEVGSERIRQIEAKALRKLRHPSRVKEIRVFAETRVRRERPCAKCGETYEHARVAYAGTESDWVPQRHPCCPAPLAEAGVKILRPIDIVSALVEAGVRSGRIDLHSGESSDLDTRRQK